MTYFAQNHKKHLGLSSETKKHIPFFVWIFNDIQR